MLHETDVNELSSVHMEFRHEYKKRTIREERRRLRRLSFHSFSKLTSNFGSTSIPVKTDATPIKLAETDYVIQIVSVKIHDNLYEAKMLLAPEVDLSSLKITVKGNNLRVTVDRPINKELINHSLGLAESLSRNLLKTSAKHQENLLVPDAVDNDTLNDYMNFELMSSGIRTRLKFNRIPNFYIIDNKGYFATEMEAEGLKVGTVTLVDDNILNIKLYRQAGPKQARNLNFLIPPQADARKLSVEVFDNDTIFLRAPLKSKYKC